MFSTTYSLTLDVRIFAGGSKVISDDASPTKADALRGTKGRSFVIPAGGLFRRSSIMANINGPGPIKISPESSLGVITESKPALVNVDSSKCEIEDPGSYVGGVNIFGLTPPFALTPRGPDQTSVEVNAFPNSREGDGKSANRFSSSV